MTDTSTIAKATDRDWWRHSVVYQIYPRSFADANGDGIGDLEGIISRVPYLAWLGVDAVWISPFYPSELKDGGYDVADYRNIDPRIGTLDQFDVLVRELHSAGIKVVVDIVPNHSSDQHPWFQEALAAPARSTARDRYIFRDGTGENGDEPPSDWVSVFGGSAWQRVDDGQYYLHVFTAEQPDFNWDNDEVRADFETTLRFWSDRGVDGFRIDVANGLTKDLTGPLPTEAELKAAPKDGTHRLWDRDEVQDIYTRWRTILNEYDPPKAAVAEAWLEPYRRARYARPSGLGQAFNFDLLEANFDADQYRDIISLNLAIAADAGSSSTWVLSNHDVVRHRTRYGLPHRTPEQFKPDQEWLHHRGPDVDDTAGLLRARAATLLLLALPGSTYLYQGEELGLPEARDIPDDFRRDPGYLRSDGAQVGRDGTWVPLPWTTTGPSFGFGPQDNAHLPQPAWYGDYAVDIQRGRATSTLELYRRALQLRRLLRTDETLSWIKNTNPEILHFLRGSDWNSITNFSATPMPVPDGVTNDSGQFIPGNSTNWYHDGRLVLSSKGDQIS